MGPRVGPRKFGALGRSRKTRRHRWQAGRLLPKTPFAVGLDARGCARPCSLRRGPGATLAVLVLSLIARRCWWGPPGGGWWACAVQPAGMACARMWSSLVLHWLAWWAMAPAQRAPAMVGEPGAPGLSGGLAAWYVLSAWAPLGPLLVLYVLMGMALPAGWGGAVVASFSGSPMAAHPYGCWLPWWL